VALMAEIFATEDVRACAANRRLQRRAKHRDGYSDARFDDLTNDVREMHPDVPLDGTEWIWFESPDWTWDALCGRAGWMLWHPGTGDQIYFDAVMIS
jgi:hypothetical protein